MPSSSIPQPRKIVIFLLAIATVLVCVMYVLNRMAKEIIRDAKMNRVDLRTLETDTSPVSVPPWVETIRRARFAASDGDIAAVAKMLKEGFDINRDLGQRTTLLMLATEHRRSDLVRFLVQHNAIIAVQNAEGRNALTFAAEAGDVDTVLYLLSQDKRIDINTAYQIRYGNRRFEKTLLGFAVQAGKLPVVRALVDRHANINVRNSHGSTVLTFAAAAGETDIVKFLISRHADVNGGQDASQTPLAYARKNHHTAVANLLQKAGAIQ